MLSRYGPLWQAPDAAARRRGGGHTSDTESRQTGKHRTRQPAAAGLAGAGWAA